MKQVSVVFAVVLLSITARGQITKVSMQAAGLTCSMCSNSIYKALKTLDFAETIDANIKTAGFDITFKAGSKIDFDAIKEKVEKAGYTVAKFYVFVKVDSAVTFKDNHVVIGGCTFHFPGTKNQLQRGITKIQLIDKGFVTAKEYKKSKSLTKPESDKSGTENANRIYHATL
jgi:copper chaperone CopZ